MSVSSLTRLLARLGPELEDPDEETFLLFASERPAAQNLGFIDSHAAVLDLTVAGRDLTIHQAPAVLTSNRSGGTTGAVLWKISPAVAEWLARPNNLLFSHDGPDTDGPPLLGPDSAILELGCGIAGLIGLALTSKGTRSNAARSKGGSTSATASAKRRSKKTAARRVGVSTPVSNSPSPSPSPAIPMTASFANANTVSRYVLTDQSYVAKFLLKNLEENGAGEAGEEAADGHGHGHGHAHGHNGHKDGHKDGRRDGKDGHTQAHGKTKPTSTNSNVLYFRPLDWETDQVTSSLLRTELNRGASPGAGTSTSSQPVHASFDAVLACDCIYNEALVAPLVQTFADACRLRETERERERERDSSRDALDELPPTVCVIAQQLRDPDVLTAWLTAFHAEFRVWRVPDALMDPALCPGAGFAVHIGILRTAQMSV